MCGIAGYHGNGTRADLSAMISLLAHRGPDDQGIFIDDGIGLANTRLSIIDLKDGHQPMSNEDSDVWVTFNGEIFNFQEHKKRLTSLGHTFETKSDTEVLVHLYEDRQSRFVAELNGMFAFGLWDGQTKTLVLGRDYAGMKPLYYAVSQDGTLYFASEIKAVARVLGSRTLDLDGLADFLLLGYVPSARTLLAGINKLRPGEILTKGPEGCSISRYHDFLTTADPLVDYDFETGLRERIKRATESWLMSDVPIGMYLSGGLDSSLIAAIAANRIGKAMTSFTAWFGPEHPDELSEAQAVSDGLSIEHSEILVDQESVIEELPRIAWMYDEPIADAAVVPTYFVSRKASSKKFKVVLAGEGADELFGGYPWYRLFRYLPQWHSPTTTRRPGSSFYFGHISARASSLVWPGYSLTKRYLLFHSVFQPVVVQKLLRRKALGQAENCFASLIEKKAGTVLSRLLHCDLMTLLAEDFLMKADKGSMANSVEERTPYLDKELMQFAIHIPDNLKVNVFEEKIALRRAAKGILPPSTYRRRKRGYGTPVGAWVRGPVGDYLFSKIEESKILTKVLDPARTKRILRAGPMRPRQVWLLGSLALWEDAYLLHGGPELGPHRAG